MRLITLHDHLNPEQEVKVDADSISTVGPFGSGSVIVVGNAQIGVHETPAEVEAVMERP